LPPPAPRTEPGDDAGGLAGRLPLLLAGVLTLIVIGGTIDLMLDRPRTWRSAHVIFELLLILLSLGFAVVLWRGWWQAVAELARARMSLVATERSLAERQLERDAWRRSAEQALAGLGAAIERQFAAWQLTPTEREVALLLLKGHGHKQIAGLTGRSERTVRQHAVAIYDKAGLGGRAELAAFFLQDLTLPGTADGTAARPRSGPG